MVEQRSEARVVGNAGILVGTQVLTKFLGAIVTIAAARMLAVEQYGLYMYAASFGMIFGLLAALGLPQWITREVARDLPGTGRTLGVVIRLEAVLTAVALATMVAALMVMGTSGRRLWVVTIVGSTMVLNMVLNVITGFFRAHQRMELEAVTRLSFGVVNLGLSLAVLWAAFGILALGLVQLGAFVGVLALGLALVMRRLARPQFTWSRFAYRRLILATLPFALASFFIFAYDGTAPIFVSIFKGDEATGLYAGAMNFVRIFGLLPASLVGAFLPAMSQQWQLSRTEWLRLYRRSLKYLLLLSLPLAVGLAMLSDQLVVLVLGQAYNEAAWILRTAAWLMILVFLNHGLSGALISIDKERVYVRIAGLALLINLVANLALIPLWGAQGAVASSLLTEALILLLALRVLRRNDLQPDLRATGLKPVVAVGIMALAVFLAHSLNMAAVIAVGVVTYGAALLALHTFDQDEINQIRLLWNNLQARLFHRAKRKPA